MSNRLTEENFFKEIKKLNIPIIKNPDGSIEDPTLYGSRGYYSSAPGLQYIVDFLRSVSKNLKDNEEKFFISEKRKNLYIVSNSHILILMSSNIQVLDNQCNFLFAFGSEYPNNSFFLNSQNFSYTIPERKTLKIHKSLSFYHEGKNVNFLLAGKNKIKISASGLGLTSLQFNEENIFATFSGLPYTSLKLDYSFNVKEIDLHKKIKEHLEINKPIICKNPNTKTQQDVFNEIKERLNNTLEFYSLVEDYKIPLTGSDKKSERDFSYIKEITSKKDKFLNVFEDNKDGLNAIKNHYNDFILTHDKYNANPKYFKLGLNVDDILNNYDLEAFTKNRQLYVLSFILLKNELKFPFINKEILNSYEKMNNNVIDLMEFNQTMLKLKSKNNKIIKRP